MCACGADECLSALLAPSEVCTVRPFYAISRGSPTFTESNRASHLAWLFPRESLGNGEVAIGAVRNYHLTRLEAKLSAIDPPGDYLSPTDSIRDTVIASPLTSPVNFTL